MIITKDAEVITIRYRKMNYPAQDFAGILNLDGHLWPKKFKVFSVKRLSDGEVFSIYDMTTDGRIYNFNVVNYDNECWAYFPDAMMGKNINDLKRI